MRNAEFHMANIDENIENSVDLDDDISLPNTKLSKKKLLFIVVPIVTVIGFSGFYYSAQKSTSQQSNTNYSIVHNNSDGGAAETITIFYDLPEINVRLKNSSNKEQIAKFKISIELSKIEDISTIEAIASKLTDAIIAHTIELRPEEISDSEGMYWLKEELLYRMNLISAPIKISNLNFKSYEIVNG